VSRGQRFIGSTGCPEQHLELRREYAADRRLAVVPRHLHAVGPVAEERQIELEGAVGAEMKELPHAIDVRGLAIRRQPHHLEFIAVFPEAEELRQREIQQAERMRIEDAAIDSERAAGGASPRRAHEIAEAVNRAHCRLVERADERGARQVRGVMLDETRLPPYWFGIEPQRLRNGVGKRANAADVSRTIGNGRSRSMPRDEECLAPPMRERPSRNSEQIHVGRAKAGDAQTFSRCTMGKAGAVFDPPEPLFLDRGYEAAIAHERGRDVAVVRVQPEDIHARNRITPRPRAGRLVRTVAENDRR
jgi:hypothetical protein